MGVNALRVASPLTVAVAAALAPPALAHAARKPPAPRKPAPPVATVVPEGAMPGARVQLRVPVRRGAATVTVCGTKATVVRTVRGLSRETLVVAVPTLSPGWCRVSVAWRRQRALTTKLAVLDRPPTAVAGPSLRVVVGDTVQLNGAASVSADPPKPIGYRWRLVTAPPGSKAKLADAATPWPTLRPDVPGAYTLQLVVDDGILKSAPATTTVNAVAAE